jgi:hypothetical protein
LQGVAAGATIAAAMDVSCMLQATGGTKVIMSERIQAWQCIGCGRLEAPQNCIGVCQDRKVELVDAAVYDDLHRRLLAQQETCGRLRALVRQLAWSTPRPDAWERSYRALQDRARALLDEIEQTVASTDDATARVARLDA